MTRLNLDQLIAVDVHVHVEQDSHGCFALDQELPDASAKYFKSDEHRHRRPLVTRRSRSRPHTPALISNGDFDAYFAWHLTQEHHRVHQAHYQQQLTLTA